MLRSQGKSIDAQMPPHKGSHSGTKLPLPSGGLWQWDNEEQEVGFVSSLRVRRRNFKHVNEEPW